jgi:hypothetical protein
MLFLGKFIGKREPLFQDSVVGWLGSATHGIDRDFFKLFEIAVYWCNPN